jgi:glycosyltransferase involved in cell wall biosynthesis
MDRCDVFVLPSRLEGLPKVTLEASAAGLPCIVFEDYRTPSVLDGETGFQVSDLESLASRLTELAGNEPMRLQMGRRAADHAQKFSWTPVCSMWERELLHLMGRR